MEGFQDFIVRLFICICPFTYHKRLFIWVFYWAFACIQIDFR